MRIELPEEVGTALQAKAAAQGLSLENWFRKLAETEAVRETRSPQEAAARIIEIQNRSQPDPEGWTVQDYINHGRP